MHNTWNGSPNDTLGASTNWFQILITLEYSEFCITNVNGIKIFWRIHCPMKIRTKTQLKKNMTQYIKSLLSKMPVELLHIHFFFFFFLRTTSDKLRQNKREINGQALIFGEERSKCIRITNVSYVSLFRRSFHYQISL